MGYSLNVFVCVRVCVCSGVLPERPWALTANLCECVCVCTCMCARECVCSGVLPERSWALTALGAAFNTAATICV